MESQAPPVSTCRAAQAHFMTASLELSGLMATPGLHLLTHLPPPPSNGSAAEQQQAQPGGGVTAAGAELGAPSSGSSSSEPRPLGGTGGSSPSRIRTLPRRSSSGGGGNGQQAGWRSCFAGAPVVDLALADAPAAVLDHGSHVFVWINPGLRPGDAAAAEALCRRFALALGAGRLPVPEVRLGLLRAAQRSREAAG